MNRSTMARVAPSLAALAVAFLLLPGCSPEREKPPTPTQGARVAGVKTEAPPVAGAAQGQATSDTARKYDGKIVRQAPANRGKDDGWFLVKNGKRAWIVDGAWLGRNGHDPGSVLTIPADEFAAIPEDPQPLR